MVGEPLSQRAQGLPEPEFAGGGTAVGGADGERRDLRRGGVPRRLGRRRDRAGGTRVGRARRRRLAGFPGAFGAGPGR
ncbi:hypothetical protein ACFWIN_00325 [Streptomyces sp. NPDC127049]|uniref:hypothetical protein n=1 Tax=Streptomyces sp. NPDC127049 TaxID=3347118 RepID=UPI00365A9BED